MHRDVSTSFKVKMHRWEEHLVWKGISMLMVFLTLNACMGSSQKKPKNRAEMTMEERIASTFKDMNDFTIESQFQTVGDASLQKGVPSYFASKTEINDQGKTWWGAERQYTSKSAREETHAYRGSALKAWEADQTSRTAMKESPWADRVHRESSQNFNTRDFNQGSTAWNGSEKSWRSGNKEFNTRQEPIAAKSQEENRLPKILHSPNSRSTPMSVDDVRKAMGKR